MISLFMACIITLPWTTQPASENIVRLLKHVQIVCYVSTVSFSLGSLFCDPHLRTHQQARQRQEAQETQAIAARSFFKSASISCACLVGTTLLLKRLERPAHSV